MFVICTCSALPIKPVVIPPIQAATTTLTATVTAMRIIDATTGLRAFAFFFIVLRFFIFNFSSVYFTLLEEAESTFKSCVARYYSDYV